MLFMILQNFSTKIDSGKVQIFYFYGEWLKKSSRVFIFGLKIYCSIPSVRKRWNEIKNKKKFETFISVERGCQSSIMRLVSVMKNLLLNYF